MFPGEISLNANDVLNSCLRQLIAAKTNFRTTSLGIIGGIAYLALRFSHNGIIESADVEIASVIAAIGTFAKDGSHTGAPPHDVLGAKDGL